MFLHRIHIRLIFFFVGLMAAVLALGGWSIQWTVRRGFESELGEKLEAVANAGSAAFTAEETGYLLLAPGPRVEERLRGKLERLREKTGVKRIVLFGMDNRVLLDTREGSRPGEEWFALRFHRRDTESLLRGESSHSILFRGIDGSPTMTGFAPLMKDGTVAGGVGVDGSAEFLGALAALQRRLLHIALIGAAATAVLALFFAKSITRPIARLVQASERIGHGRLDEQIPPLGKGEIGALAETMEAMRQRVVGRERELKAMVAGVAHEIRNPLGGIELFVGLLSDGTDSLPESQRHVEKIAKEVRYLKDIVDRFLEYARPADPQREPCRIGPVLHEVEALLEPEFRRSGAEISVAPSASSLTARIDPNHFKRIVLNLARNAIAAMPQGGRFTVSAEADERRILIRFADTGTGIAPDAKPKIFSPFFTTREKGTGLGLSIVKGLAESNGGHITLLRSDTGGTVFELDLEKV